jgi:hypothetical protein
MFLNEILLLTIKKATNNPVIYKKQKLKSKNRSISNFISVTIVG